ncbi:MAG: hypothetical protein Q4F79_09045 [Eubacteriales bacterium]|nr:hypothetical protein [Eubacteriales bacterium]
MLYTIPLISPFFRDEVLPVLLFFGMFFLIYGIGVPLFRRLPHKKGSMWDEMLNDRWEDAEQEKAAEETEVDEKREESE